ncbi:hypothetical protein VDG1235_3480 [Verrucomicrobiia bacterium DG1235]|nr:hypothetical protein VDG1235_3480 [Verrucomicrobiae bacterium DG1235]
MIFRRRSEARDFAKHFHDQFQQRRTPSSGVAILRSVIGL